MPWSGGATRTDKVLLGAILAVVALGIALRPAKPFLIATEPVLLEFLTGDLVVIGAAAAFARIGQEPLWLVVVAGALGMVKFDAITWWAGRRWGEGIARMLSTPHQAETWSRRLEQARPWVLRVAVMLAMLPGVPTALVFVVAGWTGMRLLPFLLLDLVGALAVSGLVAGLGFGLGQQAVDVVLLVDEHASKASLVLIGVALAIPAFKRLHARARSRRPRSDTRTVRSAAKERAINPMPSPLRARRKRLLLATAEILLALFVGAGLALWLFERLPGWTASSSFPSGTAIALMGAAMVLPIIVWLPLRGYPARPVIELASSFAVATLVGVLLVWTGLSSAGTASLTQHAIMLVGLLGVLSWRWRAWAQADGDGSANAPRTVSGSSVRT